MQSKGFERLCFGKRLIIGSLCWSRYLASRRLSSSRKISKTHYEVLGLKNDCTTTEIRNSFIRLSKEAHPDKNPDRPEMHKKFVLINEAYSVLSKPHERRLYDAELVYQKHAHMYGHHGVATNAPHDRVIFEDETLWESRDRSQDKKYKDRSYYGINGIPRLPNSYIAAGAVIFALIGGLLHFYLAYVGSKFSISKINEKDKDTKQSYKALREQAIKNGDEMQIALLREKIKAKSTSVP